MRCAVRAVLLASASALTVSASVGLRRPVRASPAAKVHLFANASERNATEASQASEAKSPQLDGSPSSAVDAPVTEPRLSVGQEVSVDLARAEKLREAQQARVVQLRARCEGSAGACAERAEMAAAKLRKLTIAVAQLRGQDAESSSLEAEAETVDKRVEKLEHELDAAFALRHFAQLSAEDAAKRSNETRRQAAAYNATELAVEAEAAKVQEKLDAARGSFARDGQAAMRYLVEARSVGASVNASDGFAEEEYLEAVRREHLAAALLRKAHAMTRHTKRMMHFHKHVQEGSAVESGADVRAAETKQENGKQEEAKEKDAKEENTKGQEEEDEEEKEKDGEAEEEEGDEEDNDSKEDDAEDSDGVVAIEAEDAE